MFLVRGRGVEAAGVALVFLRNLVPLSGGRFLCSSTTSATTTTTGTEETKAKKRKKKKNLFEVAQFLPNWGIGYLMAKSHWHGTGYKITKINLYKDGRHGKAWGVFHKNGLPSADGPKKISGVHKRGWRYILESKQKKLLGAETASVAAESSE